MKPHPIKNRFKDEDPSFKKINSEFSISGDELRESDVIYQDVIDQ